MTICPQYLLLLLFNNIRLLLLCSYSLMTGIQNRILHYNSLQYTSKIIQLKSLVLIYFIDKYVEHTVEKTLYINEHGLLN